MTRSMIALLRGHADRKSRALPLRSRPRDLPVGYVDLAHAYAMGTLNCTRW